MYHSGEKNLCNFTVKIGNAIIRLRALLSILDFTNEQLESVHDYIQWLFPTFEVSQFNPIAPVFTGDTAINFVQSGLILENARTAFDRILQFYGMAYLDTTNKQAVVRYDFSNNWVTRGDHNFLRLTRILKFLNIVGMHNEADALFAALCGVYAAQPVVVGRRTLKFWLEACRPKKDKS